MRRAPGGAWGVAKALVKKAMEKGGEVYLRAPNAQTTSDRMRDYWSPPSRGGKGGLEAWKKEEE